MSRRWLAPLGAGLVTAAVVFALVAIASSEDDGDGARETASREAAAPRAPGGAPSGRGVFARMGCGSCHRLEAVGSEGGIGPDLDERLPAHTRESLVEVITDTDRAALSAMPEDFGERMSEAELNALVDFLVAAGRGGA
jgi:mono/diheme cytochrome c family protein